jgi:hypothetical protein
MARERRPFTYLHVVVEHAPAAQGLLQPVAILGGELRVERLLVDRLAEQFGDIALEVGRQRFEALRLAAEGLGRLWT